MYIKYLFTAESAVDLNGPDVDDLAIHYGNVTSSFEQTGGKGLQLDQLTADENGLLFKTEMSLLNHLVACYLARRFKADEDFNMAYKMLFVFLDEMKESFISETDQIKAEKS